MNLRHLRIYLPPEQPITRKTSVRIRAPVRHNIPPVKCPDAPPQSHADDVSTAGLRVVGRTPSQRTGSHARDRRTARAIQECVPRSTRSNASSTRTRLHRPRARLRRQPLRPGRRHAAGAGGRAGAGEGRIKVAHAGDVVGDHRLQHICQQRRSQLAREPKHRSRRSRVRPGRSARRCGRRIWRCRSTGPTLGDWRATGFVAADFLGVRQDFRPAR